MEPIFDMRILNTEDFRKTSPQLLGAVGLRGAELQRELEQLPPPVRVQEQEGEDRLDLGRVRPVRDLAQLPAVGGGGLRLLQGGSLDEEAEGGHGR